jgi:hypothetical protein
LAGFEVIFIGRFCVIAEVKAEIKNAPEENGKQRN